jgi:hypothetical protein
LTLSGHRSLPMMMAPGSSRWPVRMGVCAARVCGVVSARWQ